MPEPQSRRGNVITESNFDAPFSTPIFPLGVGGIDLNSALDAIAPGRFSRLTNCTWNVGEPRALTGRPGQTAFASSGGTDVHSIVRLTDLQPTPSETTYVWGVDGDLFLGASGALTQIDTGYSGDPLSFLPLRPPLSGDPWTFIGDRNRMRKVRFDGLDVEIGLVAPTVAVTTALGTLQRTNIAAINQDAPDGTEPSAWTPNAGMTIGESPEPTNLPLVSGPAATIKNGFFLSIKPFDGFAIETDGAWSFFGLPITLNLNQVGAVEASDDDIIHLTVGFVLPQYLAEMRLYFVCDDVFSPSIMPGQDLAGTANNDFYMKTFRPTDFSGQVQSLEAQIAAAESARVANVRQQALANQSAVKGFARVRQTDASAEAEETTRRVIRSDTRFMATQDPTRAQALQASGSIGAPTEFGTIGIPLRRGDFQRYGNTAGRDWGTVTGLIIYLQASTSIPGAPIGAVVTDCYLRGGAGPDTLEPGAQSYDHRYTHYDPRTGAESNPSPVMAETSFLDSLRQEIQVNAVAYGDAAIRQRIYRRGGTLVNDWYYVGENTADGGQFLDRETDLGIVAAGTVEIDHYQPVTTVDDAGETVLAQPLPILFGPYNGQLLGLGDPYRPGYVYGSKPDEPDHWPQDMNVEVCAPSEQLMNGCVYGGQPYVFSREAGYAIYGNLVGEAGLTAAPSGCKHGLAGRWAFAVGGGSMWIVSRDNLYRTQGGPEDPVANDLLPLFQGKAVNGYQPIDFTVETALRLAVYQNELWFGYQDQSGDRHVWIMQIQTGAWRYYDFAAEVSALYPDAGAPESGRLLFGGADSGEGYVHEGTSDDGEPIAAVWRTGSWDWGKPREEKLFGDQILDVDPHNVDLTLQNFLNTEAVTNPTQTLTGFDGRRRTIWDSFGVIPQRARNLATELSWATASDPPEFFVFGTSLTMQPDLTINRVTNWDDLGHPDEVYLMGVTFDVDTGGQDREIIIEKDWEGAIVTVATLTVNTDGRHKVKFSWPATPANQVRIRPNDDCLAWILYRADWIWFPEPPRVARWDIHFENAWDQYYTGLDLYCDTAGATKRIVVEVDGVTLADPATGLNYWEVTATSRQVVHLTLPWGRGHVFRFYATDDFPGLLYSHRWHLEEEPTEQANWTSPFTILGTQAAKWLKAIVFEVDTFGEDKTVQIQADETTVLDTVTVNTTGRNVVEIAIPQVLGRVFRFFPVDNHPSRLYSLRPVFDEEPFNLTRWETQELAWGESGTWKSIVQGQITLRSTAEVTLTVRQQTSQVLGTALTEDTYVIPSTDGEKRVAWVPPFARKWILAKFLLTSDQPFYLYQEESSVVIQPFGGGEPYVTKPFGNSDADPTRSMVNTTLAAARSGGGAS